MNTNATTEAASDAVVRTHRELMRYESRTGGDWARDGYSIHMAQAAVDAARADYMAAFMAYATTATK